MDNSTLRVYWCSSPGLYNYTADLYGTRSNYTCRARHGANGCDISEIPCGEVYTVVVAPLTQEGVKGHILPQKTLLGYKMILFYLYFILMLCNDIQNHLKYIFFFRQETTGKLYMDWFPCFLVFSVFCFGNIVGMGVYSNWNSSRTRYFFFLKMNMIY